MPVSDKGLLEFSMKGRKMIDIQLTNAQNDIGVADFENARYRLYVAQEWLRQFENTTLTAADVPNTVRGIVGPTSLNCRHEYMKTYKRLIESCVTLESEI